MVTTTCVLKGTARRSHLSLFVFSLQIFSQNGQELSATFLLAAEARPLLRDHREAS